MATFTHHDDYAVVSFFDDVTWPTIVDLVDSVDTLIDSYHYTEIELQISSCGGLTDALAYFLDACPRWSRQGLRLRTRAFANAESAAAVMLSVGHDRTVEPSTLLVYHQSRLHASGPINAQTTAEMSIRLLQFDERMIGCLVDRAMQIPTGGGTTNRCCSTASGRPKPGWTCRGPCTLGSPRKSSGRTGVAGRP